MAWEAEREVMHGNDEEEGLSVESAHSFPVCSKISGGCATVIALIARNVLHCAVENTSAEEERS